MPEQELKTQAADQESLPGPEQLGESLLAEDDGVAQISPVLIIPVVIIAAVMALLLALVYGVTEEPIKEAKRKELNDKLAQVMPAFDNDPGTTVTELSDTVKMYTGQQGGEVTGYAFTSLAPKSYSGGFSVIFGIEPDGTVNKVAILETKETPGLGSKADPFILDQLAGAALPADGFRVIKDGGAIDAISGATITSRAVCDGVNLGLAAFEAAGGAAAAVPTTEELIELIKEDFADAEPEVPATAAADPEEGSDGN